MIFFGWGRNSKTHELSPHHVLVLTYAYFHVFWLFRVSFGLRYALATATEQGASAMLFYLAVYVAMSLGGFAAVLMLKDEQGNAVEEIPLMAGLSRTRPGLAQS